MMDVTRLEEDLRSLYPNAGPELIFQSNYELLVAVILSAQCTDVRVNIITADLFPLANTPEQMLALGEEKIREVIRSCGMYRQKAKALYNGARMLLDEFDGEVPATREELMLLPGVGRKTANVVLSVAFGVPAIAVDTHVSRLAFRLGLSKENNPLKIEKDLQKKLPKDSWNTMHHLLILHGRRICSARSPKCDICRLNSYCPRKGL